MPEPVLGGRYRVVRHIARGGMAEVYLAHDELLDRPVAVKILFAHLATDASFVERFRREARAAALLNHPNIVSVYDFGEDREGSFIVMEYVAGPNLKEVIASEGPLAPQRAVKVGADVAAALAAAHDQGIIHRDVKPANVLIASGVAKVADFGIAQAASNPERLTMPGAVIGTATYLSPEQAQGGSVDRRSDLYSLGMVLYEMLTGRPPFSGDNPVAVAYRQQHEHPASPSASNPAVSPQLDAVVAKAMALEPAARHQSAGELRADLLAVTPAQANTQSAAEASTVAMALPAAGAGAGSGTGPVHSTAIFRGPASRRGPSGPVYNRRRITVLALIALLIVGAVATVVLLGGKSGRATKIAVPKVIGLAVADAQAKVTQARLKPTVVEQNRPGVPGQVVDQQPAPGTQVAASTEVSLFVPAASTTTTRPQTTTRPTVRTTTTTAPTTTTTPPTTVGPNITTPATTAPLTPTTT